jgi:hypothetical protein
MASPHSFHERAGPVSDTGRSLSSASAPRPPPFRPRPRPFRLRPFRPPALSASGPAPPFRTPLPPSAYAVCSLAVSFDSMVKMAS